MNKPKITMSDLQEVGNRMLCHGIIRNGPGPDQIYMTNSNIGRKLIWVASKGFIDDWCITCHWEDKGLNFARDEGDKVTSRENILKLVDVDDEVMKHYRQ